MEFIKRIFLVMVTTVFASGLLNACPFQITNDQNDVDYQLVGASKKITIEPGKTIVMDPKHEGTDHCLTVYTRPTKTNKSFTKKYTLKQNLCATREEDKQITTSYIESLKETPDTKNILEIVE